MLLINRQHKVCIIIGEDFIAKAILNIGCKVLYTNKPKKNLILTLN